MGGGGSSGESSGDNTIHYAEFWETALSELINHSGEDPINKSVFAAVNEALGASPYDEGVFLAPSGGYFGSGYSLTDFPSLFDMFGRFMAGLDVHKLWDQTLAGFNAAPEVSALIEAEGTRLSDELEQVQLPRFQAGMRDIGAVASSAFAVGRALLEEARAKALSEFSAKVKAQLVSETTRLTLGHLDWNKTVILAYQGLHESFQSAQREANAQNLEFRARDELWDLSLYEYARALLGTVSGAAATSPAQADGPSQTQKALAGAAAGASVGATMGPWGAAAGGVLGGIAGYFS